MNEQDPPASSPQPQDAAQLGSTLGVKTLRELLRDSAAQLASVAERPRFEAELIWAKVLGVSRAVLLAVDDQQPLADLLQRAQRLLARRAAGEPMAYLLGERGFWTLDLSVNREVLIPRPETEQLVEWALALIPEKSAGRALDLGTGSGAIALAVASERSKLNLTATDRSRSALAVAQDNARQMGLIHVQFVCSDWFSELTGQSFDWIISNPPYIAEHDPHLPDLRFEPHSALVSGVQGLDDLQKIVHSAPEHLNQGGWLLLEHGADQGQAVRDLLSARGFIAVETRRDLAGLERHSGGRWPGALAEVTTP